MHLSASNRFPLIRRRGLPVTACLCVCVFLSTIAPAPAAESGQPDAPKRDAEKSVESQPADGTHAGSGAAEDRLTPQEQWLDFDYGPVREDVRWESVDQAYHFLYYPYIDNIKEFAYQYRDPQEKLPIKSWSLDLATRGGPGDSDNYFNPDSGFGMFDLRLRTRYINVNYSRSRYDRVNVAPLNLKYDVKIDTLVIPSVSWPDRRMLFEFGFGLKYIRIFDENNNLHNTRVAAAVSQTADIFPLRPFVIGFDASYARTGQMDLFEIGLTGGVIVWRIELLSGYHIMIMDDKVRRGVMIGVRLWL